MQRNTVKRDEQGKVQDTCVCVATHLGKGQAPDRPTSSMLFGRVLREGHSEQRPEPRARWSQVHARVPQVADGQLPQHLGGTINSFGRFHVIADQ